MRRLLLIALPAALLLAGCESAPVKDMQRMFGMRGEQPQQSVTPQRSPQAAAAEAEPQVEQPTRAPAPPPVVSKGAADLQTGVTKYEDGHYTEASTRLHRALSAGLTTAESVRAHKYLAFIHCASKRERQCRGEFRKALELDPGFQLNAAEAGHPIWGRVFRDAKQRG